jgi:hypothetical protein
MKIAFSLFGMLLIAVVLTCLALKILFGVHFNVARLRMQAHLPAKTKRQEAPLGLVRVIVPGSSASAATDLVGIHAFNEIYASMGVTQKEFAEWENRYGMDSAGIDEAGNMLASGYPVLSKVAWMYIDPVTLTSAETSALIQECHRAIVNSASESAKHELEAISALAEKALSNSAVIQFGHP